MSHDTHRRRTLVLLGASLLLPATPALPADRVPTPRMTEGPFYPRTFPKDIDGDLTRVMGRTSAAQGKVLDVTGRIVDRTGKPLAGARLEVWQCDNQGLYHHVGDMQPAGDPDFQGFGTVSTDAEGRYAFRTIQPVPYSGRSPHIHFLVRDGARTALVSQMFIEGGAGNEQDFLYRNLGRKAELVTMRLENAGAGLRGSLEIVV
jgi:protocatechuate 3,4-dioxygenase beta subunit